MSMTQGGGGFDVDRLLNFEKRTGIKDGEIETFITKVDAVNAAIRGMKDGTLDPSDVHVEGVPTLEEEQQMAEEKRRKRQDMERRERENRKRRKREEHEKWWRGAELLYGDRKLLTPAEAPRRDNDGFGAGGVRSTSDVSETAPAARSLSEEEKIRLKEKYSLEYSRWNTWKPQDPATLSEEKERQKQDEEEKSQRFEESNPDFCSKMVDDMKVRSEARQKKEAEANAARLKGNRFYKAKRWEQALDMYMKSLHAGPYAVNTLANVAQTLIKLERWVEAVEFCHRALHVHPDCVKALSRRASAFVKLAANRPASATPVTTDVIESCGEGTAIDLTVPTAASADGDTSFEQEVAALRRQYGGREGLMSLALADLEKAVEIDSEGEDVQRQRDCLRKEIDEESAEAEVLRRARNVGGIPSKITAAGRPPESADGEPTPSKHADGASCASLPHLSSRHGDGNSETRGYKKTSPHRWVDSSVSEAIPDGVATIGSVKAAGSIASEVMDGEITNVDLLLAEALSEALEGRDEHGEETDEGMGPLSNPLLRLTALLETSYTARIYLRASGGLTRLAVAAVASATPQSPLADANTGKVANQTATSAPPNEPVSLAAGVNRSLMAHNLSADDPSGQTVDGVKSMCQDGKGRVGGRRFGMLLSAVAAALEGGERRAQQDVHRSGLLDGCALALQAACSDGRSRETSTWKKHAPEVMGTAGAAALVVCRAVGDLEVRSHVARSIPLLSGLIGVIGADSAAPLAVQASAETLREVLLGKTAPAAVKMLLGMAAVVPEVVTTHAVPFMDMQTISPVAILGRALEAWREGAGQMRGTPGDVGEAICGALANLALHQEFRESFAGDISLTPSGDMAGTTAAVLVHVAGDRKIGRSEVRSLALATLMNACLHTQSVQAATFSAGGLALALAFISLEGEERSRNVPPLVAARSAGLLARLSAHHPALDAMTRLGVTERIMKATVRSAALGGNIYTTVVSGDNNKVTTIAATGMAAAVIEREHLVRTLASILRNATKSKLAGSQNLMPGTSAVAAPSCHVPATSTSIHSPACGRTSERKASEPRTLKSAGGVVWQVVDIAERQRLGSALVGLLPPARKDGLDGVTRDSVALRPEWSAPSSLAANVCGCLLHLLGGSGADTVMAQVVEAGGIPVLISLFANSGGSEALAIRKNAAICLAKLARQPKNKVVMTELRAMEMLLQTGSGLGL